MIRIAIDGPSGSGKSTLAKALAKELSIVYVDTGALYRTVGYYVYTKGKDPKNADEVSALLPEIHIEIKYENGAQQVYLNGENLGDKIRQPEMSMYASAVSAIPAVREFLLNMQKDIAKKNSVVMDGRDIGTVIMPDADIKIFLSATDECRAERRTKELLAKGVDVKYEDVLREMKERDANDKNRDIAPAVPAPDAVMFDNSSMTVEASVKKIKKMVKKAEKKKRNGFYTFMYWLLARILRGLYRVRVIGLENEPSDTGYIVAANHTSGCDPIVIAVRMKSQICVMGKKELFKIPVIKTFFKALGGYPIDRSGSDVGALKTTVKLLKEGKNIAMFPQGTRHPGVEPRGTEVKSGVGLIAARSGAGVIPIAIKNKENKVKAFRKTYLIIGKPIPNSELFPEGAKGNASYQKASEIIFERICELYEGTDIENVK